MFKPAKMAKIDLQVPQDHVSKTTSIIAGLKRLHLMDIRKTRVGEMDLESHADSNLLRKYTELKNRLEKIFQILEISPDLLSNFNSQKQVDPHKEVFQVEQEMQQIEKEVFCLAKDVEVPDKARHEKQSLLKQLEILSKTGVDVNQFHECRFLYGSVGLIPVDNISRLELSLSNIYHLLIPSVSMDKRRLVFVLGSRKDEDKIEKALKSAFFEKMDIPHIDANSHMHNIEILQGQIKELTMQRSLAQTRLEKVRKEQEERLVQVNWKIKHSLAILRIGKSFDKVGHTYHISGWIPQDLIPTLKKEVLEATNQQAEITVTFPMGDFMRIPTCYQNPFFLKPFEKLVSEYGVPSYREIEPTFFFAVSFLFMFGVMFGDVGHGLTLVLMGLMAFKKSVKEHVRDAGLIIMECGVMSTIFGFLYGSLFGFEHILPAFWFNPMENISYFMKVTVGFGIVIVSAGLILNIINSIKSNDYKKVFFGEFGLMGLIFYWGCVGLIIIYMTTGSISTNSEFLFVILFLPLLVIFLREPLFNLYNRMRFKKQHPIWPEDLGIYLMESLIEVGDTVIGFLSSTVSFIRVSAFALAHAGLFLAVFALANTLQNLKGGVLWYWIIMILGNIAIIIIEGVVVAIQTIRLEYYEFFSKFFKGGGEVYKPLKI